MSKAKLIAVSPDLFVQFVQRAPGEETPYFQAKVFRGTEQIGTGSNNGRGGCTLMNRAVEDDFLRLVDTTAKEVGLDPVDDLGYERASLVFDFADGKGYAKGASQAVLGDYLLFFAKQLKTALGE